MTRKKKASFLHEVFSVPIYIRDGKSVHPVWCASGLNTAETPDHEPEYEIAYAAMGGTLPPCVRFQQAVLDDGFRKAFLLHDILPGSVRLRILAEWSKLIAPLFDDFIKGEFFLNDGEPASCFGILGLAIKHLDMYMGPDFEIPDDYFENDEWCEYNDIENLVRRAFNEMTDAIPELELTTGLYKPSLAFYAVSAAEYVCRSVGWRLAIGSNDAFDDDPNVNKSIDEGFKYFLRAVERHLVSVSSIHGKKSEKAVEAFFDYNNRVAGIASRITKKYVLEAK
jgi:hypothetical protein